MTFSEECEELAVCPWCKDRPMLCSDGLEDYWVACRNYALPSEHTCPVAPVARSSHETLKVPAPRWSREEAIRKWNGWGK
jgi:hypothetical protein